MLRIPAINSNGTMVPIRELTEEEEAEVLDIFYFDGYFYHYMRHDQEAYTPPKIHNDMTPEDREMLVRLDEGMKHVKEKVDKIEKETEAINKWRWGMAGTGVVAVWAWIKAHVIGQ